MHSKKKYPLTSFDSLNPTQVKQLKALMWESYRNGFIQCGQRPGMLDCQRFIEFFKRITQQPRSQKDDISQV